MRIALYGGSFDPPHRAHLAVAQATADVFSLDRILLAPTGRQPLKSERAHASFTDRLAMVDLICQADPRLQASRVDAPRPDGTPNYTVDTLQELSNKTDDLFCIVGADSFLDLPRWRNPERLLALAQWIVASRPGFSLESLPFVRESKDRVHLLESVHYDVSATDIRTRLATGDACIDVLTAAVSQYIQEHQLYREGGGER